MSGINRFLSRREKHRKQHQPEKIEKVNPPPAPSMPSSIPTPTSSSASSFHTNSGTSNPCSSHKRSFSPSCSLLSLSIAFTNPRTKGSPRLQPLGGVVQSTTANSCGRRLLQPQQTASHLQSLFFDFEDHVGEKDDETTIKALHQRLARFGISAFKDSDIEYVLNTHYAERDAGKAWDLLLLLEDSENFIIKDYNPDVKLLGAVNRHGTTCYLDATLFAIFARLESFEAILYNTFEDEPRKRLSTLLRLWVNALRTGKLITTDITKQLQDALAKCGWHEAAEIQQQDASEAFSFITEMLELPMLTLKMDIFHQGKEESNDDHRLVRERLLEVAIPEEPSDGRIITLEECLETYFNNRIEVKRFLLDRRLTTTSMRSRWSVDSMKGRALHIEAVEIDESQPSTPSSIMPQSPLPPYSPARPTRDRASSIIQEYYPSEKSEIPELSLSNAEISGQKGRPRQQSIKKEIVMPAWQFFSLIRMYNIRNLYILADLGTAWYTDTLPNSDAQVAAHFSSKRPILGICLKRYLFTPSGEAIRRGTYIDIPLEIALPHFIHDETTDENGTTFGNFKLSLQSVVCHRGERVDSGHYVSLVRGQAPNTTADDPSDPFLAGDRWMLFDDLARERIRHVDIDKALKDESPYLLFYQVQPIDGDPGNIEGRGNPPSYASTNADSGIAGISVSSMASVSCVDGLIEGVRTGAVEPSPNEPIPRTSLSSDRRSSFAFTDSSFASPKQETQSWDVTTGQTSGNASLTVSRRPSKSSRQGSKSRPPSQSGEEKSRLSMSLTRLTGKLTKDKDKAEVTVAFIDPKDVEDSQPQAIATTTPNTITEASRLKKDSKDNKERSRSRHMGQHHLHKGKHKSEKPEKPEKSEKPDRECTVM
ncbi:hypothetical protein MMC11_003205 [Xylographa trunciseda]|nr:hypothetical protein [Xylographa trunciseda]